MPTHPNSTEEKLQTLYVSVDASLPKLDHSVFIGTRCTSIKEIEGLTASQIKALNHSICLLAAQSRAGKRSEWERDYREEREFREGTDRW